MYECNNRVSGSSDGSLKTLEMLCKACCAPSTRDLVRSSTTSQCRRRRWWRTWAEAFGVETVVEDGFGEDGVVGDHLDHVTNGGWCVILFYILVLIAWNASGVYICVDACNVKMSSLCSLNPEWFFRIGLLTPSTIESIEVLLSEKTIDKRVECSHWMCRDKYITYRKDQWDIIEM